MIELELTMGHGPGQLTEPTGPTQLLHAIEEMLQNRK